MKRMSVCLTAVLAIAAGSHVYAQNRPLAPIVRGEVGAGASETYTVQAKAGDTLSGTIELKAAAASFVVYAPNGETLRKMGLGASGESFVGFIAPISGTFKIQIVAEQPSGSPYTLRLRSWTPAERARDVHVTPIVRYTSARIKQLADERQAGRPDALTRFWSDAAAARGTLIEAIPGDNQSVLATFLWRERYETHNVKLIRAPALETADYYLSRLPDTDVWYKTMKVHRSSRFSYAFSPNHLAQDGWVVAETDPLNPRLFPFGTVRSSDAISVLDLPDAPDESWATRTPARRGSVTPLTLESSLLKAKLEVSVYTPPDYAASTGPYPLVVFFDGPAYAGPLAAPTTADNLVAAGRIRPPIICFVGETTFGNRAATLRFNPTFADAIATELVPWLRRSFAVSASARDLVVGGSSAGANAGFFVALRHPQIVGNVLSLDGGAGVGRALPQMVLDAARAPIRFYMSQSMYGVRQEINLPVDELGAALGTLATAPRLRDILIAKGYEVIYQETYGAHEPLHFRARVADAFIALLGPPNKPSVGR